MSRDLELAYLAGVVDSDGFIGVQRHWARAALDPSSSGVSGSTDGNVSIPAYAR